MRLYSIALAVLGLLFSVTAVVLVCPFASNETVEQIACVGGVCRTDDLAARAYAQLLAGGPNARHAIEDFRTLVCRNPASPFTWATMAEALAETGDAEGAKNAMLHAIERGPAIPQIGIRAGNLFMGLGDRAAASRSLAAVLRSTSDFDQAVFESFRRWGMTPSEVLPILPENGRAAQAWFYDVRQHGSSQDLRLAWRWLLDHGYADKELADSYLGAISIPVPSRR